MASAISMNTTALQKSINNVSPLNNDELSMLVSLFVEQRVKKGEVVLREGEICRSFYFVEKGYLRTWYNKSGVAINLHFTFEGGFTTNLKSYKSRQPSEVIIEAAENTVVWVFDVNKISQLQRSHPSITLFIRRLAIRLLLASEEHSNLFKMYTPTERYRYIEKNNPQLLQRVSLSQLASYLGVTRETLSRIRSKAQ